MIKPSRYSYTETVARLSQAILAAGNAIFATIDQSAAAARVGLPLRPTSLIVFGNPKGGTPLMDAFPLIALDLPLKLLVWEAQGAAVNVAYTPMSEIARRYQVTGHDALVAAMDRALETIGDAVS